jgi:2-polyprenyl-6-hydroxyphenyl methylase/3-demethylubiquinone-9 3-methyltransferase
MAGPFEPHLARLYRGFFFDVDDFAQRIAQLGDLGLVVEIGCGEGALITALAPRLPHTRFVGVDVSPNAGRLYEGDRSRVSFACCTADEAARAHAGQADLVLLCDVLHHASLDDRRGLWQAAGRLARPSGGRMILKEWVRNPSPIYHLGWFSDRFITGDRIRYETAPHWRADIAAQGWTVQAEWALAPWKTNHAFVLTRPTL